jgi:uncharacterized protein (DUF1501 family)
MKSNLNRLDDFSRRRFLEKTAMAAFGVGLLPAAADRAFAQAATAGKAKHLIYLYMDGGMSHIDTFDPKPGADTQGPTGITKTASGDLLSENFEALVPHWDKIAAIRSLTQKTGDHRGGSYVMHTSYNPRATIIHPSLGAWAQKLLGKMNPTLPDSVVIRGGGNHPGAGFMGPAFEPIPLGNATGGLPNSESIVDSGTFSERLKLMDAFNEQFNGKFQTSDVQAYNEFYANTIELMQSSDLAAFDIKAESDTKKQLFGTSIVGQGLLLASRLIRHDIRYVEVNIGGHDNHTGIFEAGPSQNFRNTAQALAALFETLAAEGKLEETLVVMTTEFGRTPNINVNNGRDHHPLCFSGMLAGAGIAGGQAYGTSDAKGYAVTENPVTPMDFNATIASAMGIPTDKTVFSPSGRPFLLAGHSEDPQTGQIVSDGKPVASILA